MISAVIISNNDESTVERSIKSVQWADEIVVIDTFSTDRTIEIVKNMNVKLVQSEWLGHGKQREFVLTQTMYEWVLMLGANEEISNELQSEMIRLLQSNAECKGYKIGRKNYFLGKWLQHGGWYPDYQLKLFRKSTITQNPHSGEIGRCSSHINRYLYPSIHRLIEKMNDSSSLEVMNIVEDGDKIRWYKFIFRPFFSFFKSYILFKGYKDGFPGFMLASYSSFSRLVQDAKCWEFLSAHMREQPLPPVTGDAISELHRLAT